LSKSTVQVLLTSAGSAPVDPSSINRGNYFNDSRYFKMSDRTVSDWVSNTHYDRGDVCSFNGTYYISNENGSSGQGKTPGTYGGWVKILQ
ncbi:hypothetical protein, partial [Cloacibacillus porcorum]